MKYAELKGKPTKEEYAAMISRALANQSPLLSEEEQEERSKNISPEIRKEFSGMVPPPYSEDYGLSEMQQALKPRDLYFPYGGRGADFNEDLVNRMLKAESDKQLEQEEKQKRFNKIKALFGL